jgi:hypothetical protein
MMQLSLFHFPDEAPRSRSDDRFQSEKWDHWWLAMLRGPRSFPDDDEEHPEGLGGGPATPRQTSFAGFP